MSCARRQAGRLLARSGKACAHALPLPAQQGQAPTCSTGLSRFAPLGMYLQAAGGGGMGHIASLPRISVERCVLPYSNGSTDCPLIYAWQAQHTAQAQPAPQQAAQNPTPQHATARSSSQCSHDQRRHGLAYPSRRHRTAHSGTEQYSDAGSSQCSHDKRRHGLAQLQRHVAQGGIGPRPTVSPECWHHIQQQHRQEHDCQRGAQHPGLHPDENVGGPAAMGDARGRPWIHACM